MKGDRRGTLLRSPLSMILNPQVSIVMAKLREILHHIEEYIIGVGLLVMLIIVFFNALSRYIVHLEFAFTMEIVTSLFPWLTFFGAAVAVKRKGHLGFSLLTDLFPQKWKILADIFALFLMTLLFAIILYFGTEMVLFERETHQVTPALSIPSWIVELSIPLGSLSIMVRTAQLAYIEFLRKE
jgi:C4-dicarboxylate transporter DctQ subunit